MTKKDQIIFTKRLAFLMRSGVSIMESLYMLLEQTNSKKSKPIIQRIIGDISEGRSLSMSLSQFPHVFEKFTVNIIKIGEWNGTLSQNLHYLSDELQKAQNLKRKTWSALVYPAVIAFVTLSIVSVVSFYLFPKLIPIFSSLKVKMPFTTKIMIFVSDFLLRYGLGLITGFTFAIFIIFVMIKKSEKIHFLADLLLLRLPLAGSLSKLYNLTAITRTMGLLLKSGSMLSEALPLIGQTMENRIYKEKIEELYQSVNRGEKISIHIKKYPDLFPIILHQMITVGENSGSLSEVFIYLSELYRYEIEEYTKNLSGLIEPILMIVMGVVVGLVAMAVITPIYGITEHLQSK